MYNNKVTQKGKTNIVACCCGELSKKFVNVTLENILVVLL